MTDPLLWINRPAVIALIAIGDSLGSFLNRLAKSGDSRNKVETHAGQSC